jgi:hypothetical protein
VEKVTFVSVTKPKSVATLPATKIPFSGMYELLATVALAGVSIFKSNTPDVEFKLIATEPAAPVAT